jgi:hypothetical protein
VAATYGPKRYEGPPQPIAPGINLFLEGRIANLSATEQRLVKDAMARDQQLRRVSMFVAQAADANNRESQKGLIAEAEKVHREMGLAHALAGDAIAAARVGLKID